MKKSRLNLLIASIGILFAATVIMSFSDGVNEHLKSVAGSKASYCGAPKDSYQTCFSCHSDGPAPSKINNVITSDIPVNGYTPGAVYTITATFVRPGHTKFGYEISPQDSAGNTIGTLAIKNANSKLTTTSNSYITQTSAGSLQSGTATYTFNWTAPTKGTGSVTFWGAFNAADNDGTTDGDSIFISNMYIKENVKAGIEDILSNSSNVKVFPNPTADKVSVQYTLTENTTVQIVLVNATGQTVAILAPEQQASVGDYQQDFFLNGKYPKGVYVLNIIKGSKIEANKVILAN